jgi:hypothetical protein
MTTLYIYIYIYTPTVTEINSTNHFSQCFVVTVHLKYFYRRVSFDRFHCNFCKDVSAYVRDVIAVIESVV